MVARIRNMSAAALQVHGPGTERECAGMLGDIDVAGVGQRVSRANLALREIPGEEQQQGAVRLRRYAVRRERDGAVIGCERLVEAAQLLQHAGAVDQRLDRARIERQRAVAARQRLVEPLQFPQGSAAIAERLSIIRPQCKRAS